MEYKFIRFSNSYLLSLTKLLTKTFSIENDDKKALIQWKYFDPFFKGKSITYIALDKNNNVVGHYSTMPITIERGTKKFQSTLSTDAATDPDHRGLGIMSKLSKKLYDDVASKGYDFSFGYPNEVGVVMDKYSKNYGYQVVGKFVRYFKLAFFRKQIPYSLVKVESQNELINPVIIPDSYFKVKKDSDYIMWRYLKKPNREYTVYKIEKNNKTVGYAVLKLTKFKCYIYDITADYKDTRSMKKILQSIENKALEHGVKLLIYNVLENTYWNNLFGFKYLKKGKFHTNYYFSIHLHNEKVVINER
jgi:predicted acetyltransferase